MTALVLMAVKKRKKTRTEHADIFPGYTKDQSIFRSMKINLKKNNTNKNLFRPHEVKKYEENQDESD